MQKDLDGKDVRDEDIPTDKMATCIGCGEEMRQDELYPSLGCEKGMVCDNCYNDDQSEPVATIIFGNNKDEPATIGSYHDDTDGMFRAKYVPTDGWRGYFEVSSDNYVRVHDDCILAYSEDEAELKGFDDALIEYCEKHNLRYARAFSRTSNVFSSGYDFFVHKEDVEGVEEFLKLMAALRDLKSKYRDPDRFAMTALTGKSGDFDTQDKLLLKAARRLEKGDDPDDVVRDIKKEAKKLK